MLYTYREEPPEHLICPISHDLIEYPVRVNGNVYEESEIKRWLYYNKECPITRKYVDKDMIEFDTDDIKKESDDWFNNNATIVEKPTLDDMTSLNDREVQIARDFSFDICEILKRVRFNKSKEQLLQDVFKKMDTSNRTIEDERDYIRHVSKALYETSWKGSSFTILPIIDLSNFTNVYGILSKEAETVCDWREMVCNLFVEKRTDIVIKSMLERACSVENITPSTDYFNSDKEWCSIFLIQQLPLFKKTTFKKIGDTIAKSNVSWNTIILKEHIYIGDFFIMLMTDMLEKDGDRNYLTPLKKWIRNGAIHMLDNLIENIESTSDKDAHKLICQRFVRVLHESEGSILRHLNTLCKVEGIYEVFKRNAMQIAYYIMHHMPDMEIGCSCENRLIQYVMPWIETWYDTYCNNPLSTSFVDMIVRFSKSTNTLFFVVKRHINQILTGMQRSIVIYLLQRIEKRLEELYGEPSFEENDFIDDIQKEYDIYQSQSMNVKVLFLRIGTLVGIEQSTLTNISDMEFVQIYDE